MELERFQLTADNPFWSYWHGCWKIKECANALGIGTEARTKAKCQDIVCGWIRLLKNCDEIDTAVIGADIELVQDK